MLIMAVFKICWTAPVFLFDCFLPMDFLSLLISFSGSTWSFLASALRFVSPSCTMSWNYTFQSFVLLPELSLEWRKFKIIQAGSANSYWSITAKDSSGQGRCNSAGSDLIPFVSFRFIKDYVLLLEHLTFLLQNYFSVWRNLYSRLRVGSAFCSLIQIGLL